MTESSLERNLDTRRRQVEAALRTAVPQGQPAVLYDAARYVLDGGGKRLRPMLVLLSAEAVGAGVEEAMPGAMAIELFHNFTLVHDDIMDRSDTRRGRPTVHVRWDEPTAILVGDLLMGLAYEHLTRLAPDRLAPAFSVFGPMVSRLCEGQVLDMQFETRDDVTPADYLGMVDRKTAALLACALELGAVIGSADPAVCERMRHIGMEMGRAFQIQDDLLDLTADAPGWGKPVGGDIVTGKRTWLMLTAMERAEGRDAVRLARVLSGQAAESDIDPVRETMERLGVLDDTRTAVIFHSQAALDAIGSLDPSSARDALAGLVRRMQSRLV